MASMAATLRVGDLPRRKVSELKRKAKRMGLTAEDYVKQLIEDDLALDRKAKSTSLHDLSAPFRKALSGADDDRIDRIVDAARHRKRSTNGRR